MRLLRRARALARIELRQLRRSKTRSALIMALVALPVAGLIGGDILLRITVPTAGERAARDVGSADLRVEAPAASFDEVLSMLPAGATVERFATRSPA